MLCAPWADENSLCTPCLGATDYSDLEPFLLAASEWLFVQSKQQFPGECSETIEPCNKQPFPASWPPSPYPFPRHISIWDSSSPFWFACGCHDVDTCSCTRRSKITLPRHPIREVTNITIDGYDFTDFELAGNELFRTDGSGWPCCGDWTISYTWGSDPPAIGVTAAAVLGCELFLSCNPDAIEGQQCRLPRNITSITRQGVSVAFATLVNPGAPFRTGIWEIDLYLEGWGGEAGGGDIMNPDTLDQYRVVP